MSWIQCMIAIWCCASLVIGQAATELNGRPAVIVYDRADAFASLNDPSDYGANAVDVDGKSHDNDASYGIDATQTHLPDTSPSLSASSESTDNHQESTKAAQKSSSNVGVGSQESRNLNSQGEDQVSTTLEPDTDMDRENPHTQSSTASLLLEHCYNYYEYSRSVVSQISEMFSEKILSYNFANHGDNSDNNNRHLDDSVILSTDYIVIRKMESLAALGAFIACLILCYVGNKRPDSLCSKVLSHLNVLNWCSAFVRYVGSFFTTLVKTPDTIEIQINSDNAGVYSMQGRRGGMEDRFTLKNTIANDLGIEFFAVYDGHGGANAAAYSERELFTRITKRIRLLLAESTKENTNKVKARTPLKEVKNLLNRMSSQDTSKFDALNLNEMKNIINNEIISFDEKLVEEYTKKQDISGTTALIVIRLIKTNTLIVANVGDSRAILCDWKNACIPLSFDHKPDKLKEYRRVMEAGGCIILRGVFRVNGILAVSRAIGDYPLKSNRVVIADPDILTFELDDLRPRFMVIASDGFWDTFSNENALQYVRNELSHYGTNYVGKGSTLAVQIAKKLAQESYNRESYDNITVIVVLFEELDGNIKSRVGMAKKSK